MAFVIKDRRQALWFRGWDSTLIKGREFPIYTGQKQNAFKYRTEEEALAISSSINNTIVERSK